MYTSIVVPLDLEDQGDRALPGVSALAAAGGLPVELLTVCAPGLSTRCDEVDLGQRAAALTVETCHFTVKESDDVVAAILAEAAAHPGALLAMATHARGALGRRHLGRVSEQVITQHDGPILLFGPHADPGAAIAKATPIVAVDDVRTSDAVFEAVRSWVTTFGGVPILVEMCPPDDDECALAAAAHLDELVSRFQAEGIEAEHRRLEARDPADALMMFAGGFGQCLLVLGSGHPSEAGHHPLGTFARTVAHNSVYPVLVVPVATRVAS